MTGLFMNKACGWVGESSDTERLQPLQDCRRETRTLLHANWNNVTRDGESSHVLPK